MTKEQVKTQIDTDITNKTTSKSISPLNVGSNMKNIIDLIPEGNSQNLQSVIDSGGYAELVADQELTSIDISTIGFEFFKGFTDDSYTSKIQISNTYGGIENIVKDEVGDLNYGRVNVSNGKTTFTEFFTDKYQTFGFSVENPLTSSNYYLPNKSVQGTYIVATVDDITNTAIPLTGTTVGNSVTGDITTSEGVSFKYLNPITNSYAGLYNYEGSASISSDLYDKPNTGYDYMTSLICARHSIDGDISISAIEIQTQQELDGIITIGAGIFSLDDFSDILPENKLIYTQRSYVDTKVADSRPYKVYTALLSQSGTNAPVATILENTLGGTVVLSYSGVGSYVATLTGVFILNKTWCSITSTASADVTVTAGRSSDNTVNINSFLSGTLTNSIMSPTCLEIRVYN